VTEVLTGPERAFLLGARRILLCTIADDGTPRPVPACFALRDSAAGAPLLYCPLDEKPKRVADPHLLARVRDIAARPSVTLLADVWDEDWDRLAWLRLHGTAAILEPQVHGEAAIIADWTEHEAAVSALRLRYPQYRSHDLLSRPMIRVSITRAVSWGRLFDSDTSQAPPMRPRIAE
jgi:PPOX class probable F420-dependent enzyme